MTRILAEGRKVTGVDTQLTWIDEDTVYLVTDLGPGSVNRAGYATMRTCKTGNSYEGANKQFAVRHDAGKRGDTPFELETQKLRAFYRASRTERKLDHDAAVPVGGSGVAVWHLMPSF